MIPRISLHDFARRRAIIGRQIIDAAENPGFFILMNQESPTVAEIDQLFQLSERFFALPDSVKARTPFIRSQNTGWEKLAQIRPSTGLPDQKESIQLQLCRKDDGTWPNDPSLPADFKERLVRFMQQSHELSMNILTFFAEALGFHKDFFRHAHNVLRPDAQSTLRLLHYHDITGTQFPPEYWRAGAHTDFDCLTMLYQRTGENGLEICPGREAHTSFACNDHWTPVEARTGEIVCNIGDMLMAWSDDRFKSLFHRVRCPGIGENQKARHSIAYFNQANKDVIIRGPKQKYPAMSAHKYILDATARNYGEMERRNAEQRARGSTSTSGPSSGSGGPPGGGASSCAGPTGTAIAAA